MTQLKKNLAYSGSDSPMEDQGSVTSNKVIENYLKQAHLTKHQIDIALRKKLALNNFGKNISLIEILQQDKFIAEGAADVQAKSTVQENFEDTLLLPLSICQLYRVVPLSVNDGALTIMAAGLLSSNAKKRILESCVNRVDFLIIKPASQQNVTGEIDRLKKITAVLSMLLDEIRYHTITPQELSMVIFAIFTEAMKKRASDIHLDKKLDPDSWISYRIDGVLVQAHLV